MPRKGHSEEQIVYAIRQIEGGKKVSEVFLDLADAQSKIERWKRDYNQQRPHSALADRTPQEYARAAMQLSFGLPAAERPNDPPRMPFVLRCDFTSNSQLV